jgi:hypothetical protein
MTQDTAPAKPSGQEQFKDGEVVSLLDDPRVSKDFLLLIWSKAAHATLGRKLDSDRYCVKFVIAKDVAVIFEFDVRYGSRPRDGFYLVPR